MVIRINVKIRLLILIFFALLGGATAVAGKVIYVDDDAIAEFDGSSWTQL